MGALNSKGQAPFLTYLTVFKSRLGVVNIVLPMTSFAYLPVPTLSRRLKERLSQSVPLDLSDATSATVLEYLVEKKLISADGRGAGRYKEGSGAKHAKESASTIDVLQADIWMADPAIESTIGVPRADNSDEVLELCFQLAILSKVKSTWTAAGQLMEGLRRMTPT
jgi:hypothetical protein